MKRIALAVLLAFFCVPSATAWELSSLSAPDERHRLYESRGDQTGMQCMPAKATAEFAWRGTDDYFDDLDSCRQYIATSSQQAPGVSPRDQVMQHILQLDSNSASLDWTIVFDGQAYVLEGASLGANDAGYGSELYDLPWDGAHYFIYPDADVEDLEKAARSGASKGTLLSSRRWRGIGTFSMTIAAVDSSGNTPFSVTCPRASLHAAKASDQLVVSCRGYRYQVHSNENVLGSQP